MARSVLYLYTVPVSVTPLTEPPTLINTGIVGNLIVSVRVSSDIYDLLSFIIFVKGDGGYTT